MEMDDIITNMRIDLEKAHMQGKPFVDKDSTNIIERFHGTIKSRTKVMRGLHTIESARLFMDGWLVHYNFFRPHMSLRDMTPAQVAGIRFSFRNWKDITEQPYERTARIPVPTPEVSRQRAVKLTQRKRLNMSKRPPRITPPIPEVVPEIWTSS